MSILSSRPDGVGFYYGFAKPDMRRIDVRHEVGGYSSTANESGKWCFYIAGDFINAHPTKDAAEAAAIAWLNRHPQGLKDDFEGA